MSSTQRVHGPRAVALRTAAVLVLVGVLLQPVWMGGWLGGWGMWGLTAHEIGANAVFAVAALELALVAATPAARADRAVRGHLVGIVALLVAIIGLGYVGERLLLLHIPLGVVIVVGASDHLRAVQRLTSATEIADR